MDRFYLLLLVASVAGILAYKFQRGSSDAPVRTGWSIPDQVNRKDFLSPDIPWLVAVFTSSSCDTCSEVISKAVPLASSQVVVHEVEAKKDKDLHDRYKIEAVPLVALIDTQGVVRSHFLGPVSSSDLWSSLAELRELDDTDA
ncbi:MAG: hypothetical protein VYC89_03765 [Actinomycetota bacterium]|nr:hypothetical protein [Actinomycetota bacterium]